MAEQTILLRAGAEVEIDYPPGFAVLELTPGGARHYLDLMKRAERLEGEVSGFLRFEVTDYSLKWRTWNEALHDLVGYRDDDDAPVWDRERPYVVLEDPGALQQAIEEPGDLDEPAKAVCADLAKVVVDQDSIYWKAIVKHSDVGIWTKELPIAVLREIAGPEPEPWAWTPPEGEDITFDELPEGAVFLYSRLCAPHGLPYDPEYWGKTEPNEDDEWGLGQATNAESLTDSGLRIVVEGDRKVRHVTQPVQVFRVGTKESWIVEAEYKVAARDEEEAQHLVVEHGLVDYEHHDHPVHYDQILGVRYIEEV